MANPENQGFQMQHQSAKGVWDNLFPKTRAGAVKLESGVNMQDYVDALESNNRLVSNADRAKWDGKARVHVVNSIQERDGLTGLNVGDRVDVKVATADPTVESGGASYNYDGSGFYKISEWDSIDAVVNYDDVVGAPDVNRIVFKNDLEDALDDYTPTAAMNAKFANYATTAAMNNAFDALQKVIVSNTVPEDAPVGTVLFLLQD